MKISAVKADPTIHRYWGLLLVLLFLLGLLCLGVLLFSQGVADSPEEEFIPVSLNSKLEANYQADPAAPWIAGVEMDLIWDTISDREPNARNLEARRAALQNSLLTPVPTVISAAACQGVHFIYAAQDTWLEAANPTHIHGSDPRLYVGRDEAGSKRLLLYFDINQVLPPFTLIHTARLEMDVAQGGGRPSSLLFYNLAGSFEEATTQWANQPEAGPLYRPSPLALDAIHVWDVTGLIRDWLSQRYPNNGLLIEAPQGAAFTVGYYSREIVEQTGPETAGATGRIGPRLVINCGGTPAQAAALNLNSPTPTLPPAGPDSSPPAPASPAASPPGLTPSPAPVLTPLPPPTAAATAIPLPSPPTPVRSTPTQGPRAASPTSIPPPPPTATPIPPDDDDDDDDDDGGDPPSPPPTLPPPATSTPTPVVDVMIRKSASPDPAVKGQTLTYTLTATNQGPDQATQVSLTDILPAALTFISASAGCSDTGGTVVCDVGTLAAGASAQRTIVTMVKPAAVDTFLVNQATINAAEVDPATGNNTAMLSTTLRPPQADLSVTKSMVNNIPLEDNPITFTITIDNAGPDEASNVQLRDALPSDLDYITARPDQGAYDENTGLWTVGSIPAGTTVTMSLAATATSQSRITNTAQIAAVDQTDPDSTPDNSVESEDDQASVVLTPTLPALYVDDVTVIEGDSGKVAATFTITLSEKSVLPVQVGINTTSGSASGPDYDSTTDILTFPPGVITRTLTVQVNGDTADEADEIYYVDLQPFPLNAVIARGRGTGVILDDDDPEITINDVSLEEGDSGDTIFLFDVTLSKAGFETVTVEYSLANGTATTSDNDYVFETGTLTFTVGNTQQTESVRVRGDTIPESSETFLINLSNPSKGTISDGQGVGTIINDDAAAMGCSAPVTTLSATADTFLMRSAPDANHGLDSTLDTKPNPDERRALIQFDTSTIPAGSSISCAALLLRQTSASTSNQTIHIHRMTTAWVEGDGVNTGATWNRPDKAAASTWTTAGGDFASPSVATFIPNAVSHAVDITTLTQLWATNPASNSGLLLRAVDNPANGVVEYAARESGNPPELAVEYIPGLSISDGTVTEGDDGTKTITFDVTLSAASGQPVTVAFATANNTATTADNDYQPAADTLNFSPGDTSRKINVTVNGDLETETDETFFVNLSGPTNAGLADAQAVGTIENDD